MSAALKAKLRKVTKASRSARAQKDLLKKRLDAAKKAWRDARQVLVGLKAKVRTSAGAYANALSRAALATDRLEAMGAPNYPVQSSASDDVLLEEVEAVIQTQVDEINSSLEEFE